MRTRRAALAAALTCLVTAAVPSVASADEGAASYVTQPKLTPPLLTVNTSRRGQAPGYVFMAPFLNKFLGGNMTGMGGPMLLDSRGHYVWMKRAAKSAPDTLNFQTQTYQGKPVLTYWDGTVSNTGEMKGTWHVLNNRYRQITTIGSQDGWDPSGHEFFITKRGTVLTTGYRHVEHQDLTAVGGDNDDTMIDSGVVEYDLKTGKIVRSWSGMDHIPLTDTYMHTQPDAKAAFDPTHINSVQELADGSWIVSMRNTWTIYKVNPASGAILWQLGGKHSSFTFGDNAAFAFQHDARVLGNGQLSVFDNNCCSFGPPASPGGPPTMNPPISQPQSRGLLLNLDEQGHTATEAAERKLYDLTVGTQGNVQVQPNGNWFIGWGQQPFYSEYNKNGTLLLSVRLPDPDESYRAYRDNWVGHPTDKPRAAARAAGRNTTVYMSWNGATDVTGWRIWAGPTSHRLKVVAKKVGRNGFETSKRIRGTSAVVKVQALNRRGRVIGTSRAVRRQNISGHAPTPTY